MLTIPSNTGHNEVVAETKNNLEHTLAEDNKALPLSLTAEVKGHIIEILELLQNMSAASKKKKKHTASDHLAISSLGSLRYGKLLLTDLLKEESEAPYHIIEEADIT